MTSDEDTYRLEFEGRSWLWPRKDTKLQQVNSWVHDLDTALLVMERLGIPRRVAVQAGGACGIWPVALADEFDLVYTYEPDPLNFWCLAANVSHLPNKISAKQAALGEKPGHVAIHLHPTEKGNAGAYYTMPGGDIPQIRLDDEPLFNVDLLCLDIEGREVEALRGAYNLIETWKPIIMIEEKPLPQMGSDIPHQPGAATEWLEKIHKYRVVKKVHRDVILAPAMVSI